MTAISWEQAWQTDSNDGSGFRAEAWYGGGSYRVFVRSDAGKVRWATVQASYPPRFGIDIGDMGQILAMADRLATLLERGAATMPIPTDMRPPFFSPPPRPAAPPSPRL